MSSLASRVNRIKPSPTIAVSTRAQELKASGRDIINLGSGEPDFDTPQHIKDAAITALENGQTKYTAVGGTPALKQAIVNKFQRENNLTYTSAQIIVSTGAKQALMNLLLAVLDPGDEVIIPAPYWVSYPDMALLADATPVIVAADAGFKITPAALQAAITPKSKMVIFNSPSNPSGVLYTPDEWRAFAAVLQQAPNIIIASDDIYEHLRYTDSDFSNILNVCPDLTNRTVLINGVSKAYAMTGWRIGYAAGDATIIKAMQKIQSQSTSNPCSIAQAAAQAALESGTECLGEMLHAFDRRRQLVTDGLNSIPGIHCPTIEGAFYAFADAKEAIAQAAAAGKIAAATDLALSEYLLEQAEVAVVPGSAFGCDNCFRISFATSDENLEKAIQRISAAL
ncbi:MAG: pyridoxal phosphate-dependent aminotransferase [Proteobacteria bacterium]|nr:pyridoxal phosphate-dependent aminotransferase [Pseudomonadota bacterium]MCH9757884.1 pyridoxal phosphate-dependent aminotransferase [Pseudomonadota bacterium]